MKSSPLSLRSADNANYSEVQDLKDRIAKLTAEKEYLKGQYDQQKEHDKAYYDNLLAQHNNLNIEYGNLQNRANDLERYVNGLHGNAQNIRDNIRRAMNVVNAYGIPRGNPYALNALGQVANFLNQI